MGSNGWVTSSLELCLIANVADDDLTPHTNAEADKATWYDISGHSYNFTQYNSDWNADSEWEGDDSVATPCVWHNDTAAGAGDYWGRTAASWMKTASWSLEMWLNSEGTSTVKLAKGCLNTSDGWYLNLVSGTGVRLYIGGVGQSLTALCTLAAGWNHLVITCTNGSQKVYLNNGSPSTDTLAYAAGTGTSFTLLGVASDTAFNGKCAAIRYYSKVLSASEVSTNYACGKRYVFTKAITGSIQGTSACTSSLTKAPVTHHATAHAQGTSSLVGHLHQTIEIKSNTNYCKGQSSLVGRVIQHFSITCYVKGQSSISGHAERILHSTCSFLSQSSLTNHFIGTYQITADVLSISNLVSYIDLITPEGTVYNISSTGTGVSNLSGHVNQTSEVTTGMVCSSSMTAIASVVRSVTASVKGQSSLNGTVVEKYAITGHTSDVSSLSGHVHQGISITGSIKAQSSLTAYGYLQKFASCSIIGTSTVVGNPTTRMPVTGSILVMSSIKAGLIIKDLISCTFTGTSNLRGLASRLRQIGGSYLGTSTASANLFKLGRLMGVIVSHGTLSGHGGLRKNICGHILSGSSVVEHSILRGPLLKAHVSCISSFDSRLRKAKTQRRIAEEHKKKLMLLDMI